MADAIQIDAKLFQERISHFINAWKNDRRSGDALFGGVASIVVMMGKVEEAPSFNKNNAMHVRTGSHRLSVLVKFHRVALHRIASHRLASHRG